MSDPTTNEAKGDLGEAAANTVRFDYIKSALFRIIHADGVIGGLTPRLDIQFNVWSERFPIPQSVTHPHFRVREPLEIIRQVTMRGNITQWAPYPYPPVEGQTPNAAGKRIQLPAFHIKEGEYIRVLARFTRAIVLNYDCDLVHEDDDHCTVAIVRPMASIQGDEDRARTRRGEIYDHFWLPPETELALAEAYVDFRQVTCFDPAALEKLGKRRASLTDEAVKALQAGLFRFLTRREILPSPDTR